MKIGPLPAHWNRLSLRQNALGWIRGFMVLQLARRSRIMMLTVPAWPESVSGRCRPAADVSGIAPELHAPGLESLTGTRRGQGSSGLAGVVRGG
jgi:hypothetical protein